MSYRVAYDIVAGGYDGWAFFAIAGGLFAASSGALALARRRGKPARAAAPGFVITGIFFAVACAMPYADHLRLCQALRAGTASVVEGTISGYALQRQDVARSSTKRDIRTWESFTVGGVRFQYSQDNLQAGFRNVGAQKTPLRDGLGVRIHYVTDRGQSVEQRIVRVEVEE